MTKRKIIGGMIIVFALAALAYYALQEKERKSTLNISESAFSVKDTASIDKIFIASKFGWSSLLEKNEKGRWILNNEYKVNKSQISILLKTLYWQRIKRPVHKGEREMVIKNIATKGSKVEVYQNGEKTKVFYVGGDANDSKGTYFIMEDSENPFVVYMPNHIGFLSPRYVVKEENYRDTKLFSSNLSSFEQIQVEYPANPSQSFIILKEENEPKLLGLENYDEVALKNYISGYNRIHVTHFIENEETIAKVDSLRQGLPIAVISVKDKVSAYSNRIDLFQNGDDPDGMLGIAKMEGDDRYVVVQNYVFNKLLVPVEVFKKE